MTARDIGVFLACSEYMVPADRLNYVSGMAKAAATNPGVIGRLLVKSAHACMVFSKQGHTAPAMHLQLIADAEHWGAHHQDVANHVSRAIQILEPMHKQAFSELSEGIGAGARGLGYASVGAGAGLGALAWLLSRHANQEAAELEAKKNQISYYHRLSHELNDSMRRKYDYAGAAPQPEAHAHA